MILLLFISHPLFYLFFFNDTATTEIYTLSLHDALPICRFHHAQKTHEGYRLEGGPGHWRWLQPDGTEVAPRPPPRPRPPPDDDGTGTIAERQVCNRDLSFVIANTDHHSTAPGVARETRRALRGRRPQALAGTASLGPAPGGAAGVPRGARADQARRQARLPHHLARRAPLLRGPLALACARGDHRRSLAVHRADPPR